MATYTDFKDSGIGQLTAILKEHLETMQTKNDTVDKIISSAQTADSLRDAKQKALENEKSLLQSIMNDIDEMNTFLKNIILIENLFTSTYQPFKEQQERARAKYAKNIAKYEDRSKVQSGANSFVELIFGGQTHVSSFQKWLNKVSSQCVAQNVTIISNSGAKVKKIERAFYKAFYVYNEVDGFKEMTDILRCSLVFDNFDDLYKCFTIIEALSEDTSGGILRAKDRFHPVVLPFGYRDLLINLFCPRSKIVAEIQLHFNEFYKYKKISHTMYKKARLFERETGNLAYQYSTKFLRPKLGSIRVYKATKEDMQDEDNAKTAAADMRYNQLLTEWGLQKYIAIMLDEGWEDPLDWSSISDEDLKNDMNFSKGHIRKFRRKYDEWMKQIEKEKNDTMIEEQTEEGKETKHNMKETKDNMNEEEIKEEKVVVKELKYGRYRIYTAGHKDGQQPAGWGLAAWNAHGAKRNDASSWVAVHSGDHWPCDWFIEGGKQEGTYRIKTAGHKDGKQPSGWGLSAWNAHGAKRNDASSRVAVHEGDHWPCDWFIVRGKQKNTWRIKTAGHKDGQQAAGWGLAAWNAHGAKRNDASSWVHVHDGDHWPCDWILKRISDHDEKLKCGKYRIYTAGHTAGQQPAGWGLSAWNAHGAERNNVSSWVAVHSGDHWPCDWFIERGQKEGTYRIKTAGHKDGKQPAGWGLSAWNAHGAKRNDVSSRVAVHEGDHWPCDWFIVRGKEKNTWRINTAGHKDGQQAAGWGLAAWNAHGAKRNDASSWVHVHAGDHWPCDWIFKEI